MLEAEEAPEEALLEAAEEAEEPLLEAEEAADEAPFEADETAEEMREEAELRAPVPELRADEAEDWRAAASDERELLAEPVAVD